VAGARRVSLCAPRLADPLRPTLPLFDPFGEPGQVGPGGDEQRCRERLTRPLVPVVAGVEAKGQPGPFGQQIATPGRDLSELGDRGVDVQRFPARVPAGRTGKPFRAACRRWSNRASTDGQPSPREMHADAPGGMAAWVLRALPGDRV
jgi:hypothetical protein